MKILVIGGTGMVGARVVEALLSRGADVRVLSRSPGDRPGVEYVAGDLAAPETLIPAFEGVSKHADCIPLPGTRGCTDDRERVRRPVGHRRTGDHGTGCLSS